MKIKVTPNDMTFLPEIHETSPKRKNNLKSCNFPSEEKGAKFARKILPLSSNFYDSIKDINNEINAIDTMRKHYYGEDCELTKRKIQQILREENTFFTEDGKNGSLAMKYLYYPNVGLSTSQSLMRDVTTFLRANDKIYNAPDRSKFEKKLFLKDVVRLIMFDLKPVESSHSKKFTKGMVLMDCFKRKFR